MTSTTRQTPSNKDQVPSNKIVNEPLISAVHSRAPTLRYPVSGIRYPLLFLLAFAICHATPAAGPQDLGQNLSYVRLHRLPEDAAALTAAWSAPALIVDLRYPAVDGSPAIPAGRPVRPRTAPLFVLIAPGTPVDALAALRTSAPALITLGLPAPGLTPDIALAVDPATDRRAYDALDAGTAVDALIIVKIAKQRFDEAALAREHEQGDDSTEATEPPPPVSGPPAATAAAAPTPPPPLIDVVLQRAVQLHRALLALGKL